MYVYMYEKKYVCKYLCMNECMYVCMLGHDSIPVGWGRDSILVRRLDSQSREPCFKSHCSRFEPLASLITPRCHSSLSCINEYLAIQTVVDINSLRAAIAAWLNTSQRSWYVLGMNRSARGWSVKRFEQSYGPDTVLYKNIPLPFTFLYMYECMYECMFEKMYVCMYVWKNVGMYLCMTKFMNVWKNVFMYVCMYEKCMYLFMYDEKINVCMYVFMKKCIYVCLYEKMYVCMYVCIKTIYVCMYVRQNVSMYLCIKKYVCMYKKMYVCMYIW